MATVEKNKINGSMGEYTIYNSNGKTIVRQRNSNRNDKWSPAQAVARTSIANNPNIFSAIRHSGELCYENLRAGCTNYGMFLAFSRGLRPIFLTKDMATQGCCVVEPYLVADGTLPSIHLTDDGQGMRTDIAMGSLTITPETTVSSFSRALLRNNPGFKPGDKLICLRLRQQIDPENGYPRVCAEFNPVVLDIYSTGLLRTREGRLMGFAVREGFLASEQVALGGVAWIHQRELPKKRIRVSRQRLHCNTQELQDRFGSPEAFEAACRSYGQWQEERFLEPDLINEL